MPEPSGPPTADCATPMQQAEQSSTTLSMLDTGVLRRRLVDDGLAELDDAAEHQRRRVRLLYQQTPISLLATVMTGIVMVSLSAGVVGHIRELVFELAWLAAALVLCLVRFVHARRVLRRYQTPGFAGPESAVFIGALAAGLLWGLAPVAARGDGGLLTWMPVLMMVAMMAGASVAFAASLRCFAAFCVPIYLGLLCFAVLRGDGYTIPLVILATVFTLLMTLYVRQYHTTVVRSLGLRSENRHLLMNLNRNNSRLKSLNASLEGQVEARTAELENANATLRTDIKRREEAERALRESEVRFRALYDDSPSMSFMLRPDGEIVSVNACGAQVLGLPAAAIVGREWSTFVFSPYRAAAKRRMQGCLDAPGTATYGDLQVVRGDGSTLWLRVASRALRTVNGALEVLVTCQDVTDARLLSEQLGYFASHDTLTGLVNRRAFEERVRRVLRTAGEQSSDHAVCYLDLDYFKVVNDEGGHAAGDELLRQLAKLMREKVRRRDTLARLGGDEFGLLMEHCSIEQAMRIGTGLRDVVSEHVFQWEEREFKVGVSVGVAELNARTGSLDEALRRADAACYQAKESGRNTVVLYDGSHGPGAATMDTPWLEALESAIAESRFVVNAQRIVAASDNRTQRPMAQALVQYRSTSGELVSPASYIGAAERYGVAAEIDYWALDQITSFLGTRAAGGATVILKVSARSLTDADFVGRVEGSVQRSGIDPRQLCLEVSEAVAIVSFNEVRDVMRRLRAVGCRFALGDFGSGLSSLAQLRALPVDFVRIDTTFSQDVEDNALQAAMVRSVTDVGHTMGKRIIAEGVNDRARMDTLRSLGVDFVQGYAVGDVLPLAQVLDARVDPREDRVIELRR